MEFSRHLRKPQKREGAALSEKEKPNRKSHGRLPIWKGGAAERYRVFGASPQTDAGNDVSAACSDVVVRARGLEPRRSPTRT